MIVRQASETDIPEIISLLKASLGESLMPKSESYWRWKHIGNPFDKSPVLVAEEDGQLVGVRAFMRWRWEMQENCIEAVRAVDTATHPDFQGKGIFSKLTTTLLTTCRENHLHMVYNTPNNKSMPGYLKMGWKKAGNLPLDVKVVKPWSMISSRLTKKDDAEFVDVKDDGLNYFLNHNGLAGLIQASKKMYPSVFRTAYSAQYCRWRYSDNPVARYHAAGVENGTSLCALFFYRIKPTKWGYEFRVTDLFLSSMNELNLTRRLLNEKIRLHRAHFVTFAGNVVPLLNGMFQFHTNKLGPVVTVRDILPQQIVDFINFQKWSPSLGDMELF